MIQKSFENYVEVIQNIPPGLNKKNKKIVNIFDLFSRILKLNKHNQIRQRQEGNMVNHKKSIFD